MRYQKCVFAGSFDPVTNGHMDVIGKCAMMFDKVVVVLAVNAQKTYLFDREDRLKMLCAACQKYSSVSVREYDGMIVECLKEEETEFYVRGIRDENDLDYEGRTFDFNSKLYPDIQTVYLNCSKENKKISSTFIREQIMRGKDVSKFVPYEILPILEEIKKKITQ